MYPKTAVLLYDVASKVDRRKKNFREMWLSLAKFLFLVIDIGASSRVTSIGSLALATMQFIVQCRSVGGMIGERFVASFLPRVSLSVESLNDSRVCRRPGWWKLLRTWREKGVTVVEIRRDGTIFGLFTILHKRPMGM
jgi:hypothetical protein